MVRYAGPDTDLTPDAATIRLFLSWWFERCTHGVVEIGWLSQDRQLTNFQQFELGQWDELVAFVYQENLVPGQSMYFRAATVRAGTGGRTSDEDFISAPGPWNDIDTQEQLDAARQVQTMIRANGRIVTGTVPHTRAQSFFRCDAPIVNQAIVRSLNTRIHKLYGGDSSVINPSRLMRLAGTIAWPWKPGRVPEVTQFAVLEGRNPAYPLALLTSQLPQEEPVAQPDAAKTQGANTSIFGLSTSTNLLHAIRTGQQWHNNMVKLTAHWIGRGWSNAEILAAAEAFTMPGYTHNQTAAEVTKAIDGARRKWGVENQDHVVAAEPQSPFAEQIIDPWDTLQPPAFPIEAVPGILRGYVEARARTMGADPCAITWAAISACSAALDGRTRLRMKRHDTWSVPPAIWVALIGRSSTKKTPIISDAWRPLEELQAVALREYNLRLRAWDSLPKEEKAQTDKPLPPRRLLSHDATMESVQSILSHQDRGIGILRDELAGLIGAMDKYSGPGMGGAADRAFWLQAYNGGSHVVDRVSRGTVAINNLLATICGAIQPERLAQLGNLADDGFMQRLVPIIVANGGMGTDEPPPQQVEDYRLRLQGLVDQPVATGAALSDGAQEVRRQIEQEIFELEQLEPLGSKFSSFVGKLPGLWGRLALVLSHIEPSGVGMGYIVHERAARAARTLIMQCVVPHAARVYMTMGGNSDSLETMQGIAGYVLAKKLTRVVVSDLTSNVRQCRRMPVNEVARAVSPLISGGWLNPETDGPGNRAWLVNPAVHVKFENRAGREIARRAQARFLIAGEDEE